MNDPVPEQAVRGADESADEGRRLPYWRFSRKSAARCVIIGAAPSPSGAGLIAPEDFVAVCDGGLEYAVSRGISFGLLAGDFDSCKTSVPRGGFETVKLAPEKNDTDTEHAARLALERGFREFILIGAAGGRTDHFLGNLAVGRMIAEAGGSCVITGTHAGGGRSLYGADTSEMFFIFADSSLTLGAVPGAYVSLFPLSGALSGVTLEGFKYPAGSGRFSGSDTLGVSNEFLPGAVSGTVTVEKGVALVAVSAAEAFGTV